MLPLLPPIYAQQSTNNPMLPYMCYSTTANARGLKLEMLILLTTLLLYHIPNSFHPVSSEATASYTSPSPRLLVASRGLSYMLV